MNNVLQFNLKRNKLSLDARTGPINLEKAMLKEEIQEFYEAKTLAERIDAMIDVRYVYEGMQLKYNYNMFIMDADTTKVIGQFHSISTTLIAQELGDDAQYLDKIMDAAWDIVCRINAMKSIELDADGKVIKQADLPNATEEIAAMLDSVITKPE